MNNQPSLLTVDEQPDPIDVRNRLEAERITAHWRTGNTMALPDYSVGPLFLNGDQQRTFEGMETK